jgi:hypothetical protein
VSSNDPERVARLFRCPRHTTATGLSYLVLSDKSSGLPVLICTHHPGIIIKAHYRREQNGELKVTVEERVWETVTPESRKAIRAAAERVNRAYARSQAN